MTGSPERKEAIRVLWGEGLTAAMIAKRLGCTRNVVMGIVYRIGLSRDHAVRPMPDGKPRRAPKRVDEAELRRLWATALPVAHVAEKLGTDGSTIYRAAKRLGLPKKADARGNLGRQVARARSSATERAARNMKSALPKVQPLPMEPPAPPGCKPVSLLAASFGQCRYPVAEWAGPDAPFYCGAPTMDDCGPYCRWHARIAYQSDSQRRWQTARHPGGVEAMLRRAGA